MGWSRYDPTPDSHRCGWWVGIRSPGIRGRRPLRHDAAAFSPRELRPMSVAIAGGHGKLAPRLSCLAHGRRGPGALADPRSGARRRRRGRRRAAGWCTTASREGRGRRGARDPRALTPSSFRRCREQAGAHVDDGLQPRHETDRRGRKRRHRSLRDGELARQSRRVRRRHLRRISPRPGAAPTPSCPRAARIHDVHRGRLAEVPARGA